MSDELIEGKALRGSREPDSAAAGRKGRSSKAKPADPPTSELPFVSLEPPEEAGDVIRKQAEAPTFHRGLEPVVIEDKPSARKKAPREPEPPEPPDDPAVTESEPERETELPWAVVDEPPRDKHDSEPIMRLPKVSVDEDSPRKPARKVPDFVPQLHTPTGELSKVPASEDDDFVPNLHTPTGELPPVKHQRTPPVLKPILEYGASLEDDDDEEDDDDLPSSEREDDEPSGEIVEADWIRDADDPGTALRRKVPGTVQWAAPTSFWQKYKLPITFFAVLIGAVGVALGIKFVRDASATGSTGSPAPEATDPLPGQSGTSVPGGIVTPEGQTAAPTGLPPYAVGRIAFASNRDGDFEIYVLDLPSGAVTQITADPGSDRSPVWSPDGRQILFVSDRAGDDDLYLVSAQGGEAVQLTGGASSDRNPAWSPDGQTIVLSRENVDGSRLMAFPATCLSAALACEDQLTLLTPGGYDRFPAWSPDGMRIAFAAGDFPGLPTSIALINPDGGGYAGLLGTQTSDFGPAWSPDGAKIAFVSLARGDYDVWIMTPNGGIVEQITRSSSSDIEPAWSPDGAWLVFASDRGATADFELYIVPSGCGQPETGCDTAPVQLTDNDAEDYNPVWRP